MKNSTFKFWLLLGSLFCVAVLIAATFSCSTDEEEPGNSEQGETWWPIEDEGTGEPVPEETPSINTDSGNNPSVVSVKVAFIGDQGNEADGDKARDVLELIKNEAADFVIHSGDFDYDDDPTTWDALITHVLGENYPYFASIGNHDEAEWTDYQTKLTTRLSRLTDTFCSGDLGVNSACTYKGIFFILSGIGSSQGLNHADYIESQLKAATAKWRICSWHKNQQLMQIEGKSDEVGWDVYEKCREGGAMIATAHAHVYCRTHLMSGFSSSPTVSSTSNTLEIEKGKTFAFVSGLGGASIRATSSSLHTNPWWGAALASDTTPSAQYGALFCTFNEGGIEENGSCSFKTIDGTTLDSFSLKSKL